MIVNPINVTFDFRDDSKGKDPDSFSDTLRKYHKLLWSKNLPNGKYFDLDNANSEAYLYHKSELGEYFLSSDSIIHTYFKWKRTQNIISGIPSKEMEYFYNLAYTIGGFIVFPGNRVNGLQTINQEKGFNKKINDRIDLTLECIRLFYINKCSPLFDVIKRYCDFFSLFGDFQGYCEYFLLQDLVKDDFTKVKFFIPFEGFFANPLPQSVKEYRQFKSNNIRFLRKRNKRIKTYTKQTFNNDLS